MTCHDLFRGCRRAVMALLLCLPAASALADFTDAYNAAARREWDAAAAEFKVLAEQGDARAQVYLATLYRRGLGVPRDLGQAVHWYGAAAEQGDVKAMYNLAVHYREGLGTERDDARATELFAAAAEQGMVEAQINLGLRLLEGAGVEPDRVRGLAWLEKAAASGNAEAARRRDHHARQASEQEREAALALSRKL